MTLFNTFNSGDSYSSTQFCIEGGFPSTSSPIGQPALPGSTTSGGLNWVGVVTSELNTCLVLSYDWAYYGADTSNAIINNVSQLDDQNCVSCPGGQEHSKSQQEVETETSHHIFATSMFACPTR